VLAKNIVAGVQNLVYIFVMTRNPELVHWVSTRQPTPD
jgi:hypothetical protein